MLLKPFSLRHDIMPMNRPWNETNRKLRGDEVLIRTLISTLKRTKHTAVSFVPARGDLRAPLRHAVIAIWRAGDIA